MNIKKLVGSGDKVMGLALPFLVAGLILNILFPAWFRVGGPSTVLKVISYIVLVPGVVIWIWSAVLILIKVPQNKLITSGPYALMKHPIYSGFGLLVLPWLGFLLNSWLGVVVGLALFIGSKLFSPAEEAELSKIFGTDWDQYNQKVLLPWL